MNHFKAPLFTLLISRFLFNLFNVVEATNITCTLTGSPDNNVK